MTPPSGGMPTGQRGAAAWRPAPSLLLLPLLLLAAGLLHLAVGAKTIPLATVVDALLRPEAGNFDHHVLWNLRMPRLAGALTVGASLGLAGALIQAVTRNPLGEPQLLGLNAGAAFAVAATTALSVPVLADPAIRPLTAAVGGALLFAAVMGMARAGRSGMTIIKLTFCGIALSAFVSALTSALLILDEDSLQDLRIWLAGDLAEAGAAVIRHSLPVALAGALLAALLSRRLHTLALGDSAATGLGTHVARTRAAGLAAAALLCGAAVSIAGPLGFIGLVAPHMARRLDGRRARGRLLAAAACGAVLVVCADIVSRVALAPRELATGVVTALVGVPVFLALVLRRRT
ncbi:ABC-type Fe3+-siderophore transport system, permease component [plant metagenome]|uniref:ABC-type Fe3+-siderophore transport system, permease component n=1 Tax=plant metagenome TaxID=1297885 RepID=A0A484PVY6_9ZZZZ